MKKILLGLILVFMVVKSFSINADKIEMIEMVDGKTTKETKIFNTNNLVVEELNQELRENGFVTLNKTSYYYDQDNNLSEVIKEDILNDCKEKTCYYYDINKLIQEEIYINDDLVEVVDYNYDITNSLFEVQYTDVISDEIYKTVMYKYSMFSSGIIRRNKEYTLKQNYPNPFNPKTTIEYTLNNDTYVSISVYDVNGVEVRKLVNDTLKRGLHKVVFDASGLSSGEYFYTIKINNKIENKKMLFVK